MNPGAGRPKLKLLALAAALALANLLLAAAIFGPNLALRLYLERFLPSRTGLAVSCQKADLLAHSLTLENLVLTSADQSRLTLGRVEISGLKLLNILSGRPGLDLAETLNMADIHWANELGTISASSLRVLGPNRPAAETDLPFRRLDITSLEGQGPGRPSSAQFQVKDLHILNSGEFQADLAFQVAAEAGLWTGEVEGLTLDDAKTAFDNWLQSQGQPWGLLPELFHLRLASGRLDLDGRPAFLVKTAHPEPRFLFTKFGSEAVSYGYFLELTLSPEVLGPAAPFWSELAGLAGPTLDLEMSLDLTLDPEEGAGQLRSLSLEGRGLGRLDLAFELSDLWFEGASATEILAALSLARLHSLSLVFQDQGFMTGYYAWLAKAAGCKAAEVPGRLKADFLAPLVEALAEEGGMASLPALAEAARAFLDQPENLMLLAEPARPWPLVRLVKTGGYDIINDLGMTLTVNDRPPVPVVF